MGVVSFGGQDARFLHAEPDHAAAFASWQAMKQEENQRIQSEARALRSQHGAPLIVVVDEEQAVAVTLSEILRRRGKIAVWFTEPLRALQYFRSGTADLLLADINLPTVDGFSLAAKVQAVCPACEILLLHSITAQPEVTERAERLGPNVRLASKPLPIPLLLSSIDELLAASDREPSWSCRN
jgi:CheY-like chemotaxis protein